MKKEQNSTDEPQDIPFFWKWVYPILLCVAWGGVIGLLMALFQGNSPNIFSVAIGGSMLAVILFIMYETPFNKLIQLLVKIPFVWIIFIFPLLMYWVFVWPISFIDTLIGKIMENKYSTNLDPKSLKNLKPKTSE